MLTAPDGTVGEVAYKGTAMQPTPASFSSASRAYPRSSVALKSACSASAVHRVFGVRRIGGAAATQAYTCCRLRSS